MQYAQQPDLTRRTSSEQSSGGDRFRQLLMSAGFTEEQIATGLAVDERTVGDWCEGNAVPPQHVIDALERLVAVQQRLG